MTYKDIINRIRTVVDAHLQLQDFGYGQLSDLKTQFQLSPQDQGVDYPYLFLLPQSHQRQGPVMNYSFNMIVMDMARGEEGDVYDNYITIQSQCQEYIDDVIANLYYHYKDQPDIELTGITYTPFKEKYQDDLAGMTATITIQVPTPLNDCIAPIVYPPELMIESILESNYGLGNQSFNRAFNFNEFYNPNGMYLNVTSTEFLGFPGAYKMIVNQPVSSLQAGYPPLPVPVYRILSGGVYTDVYPTTSINWPVTSPSPLIPEQWEAQYDFIISEAQAGVSTKGVLQFLAGVVQESLMTQYAGGAIKIYRLDQ